jgi:hypothetical protein
LILNTAGLSTVSSICHNASTIIALGILSLPRINSIPFNLSAGRREIFYGFTSTFDAPKDYEAAAGGFAEKTSSISLKSSFNFASSILSQTDPFIYSGFKSNQGKDFIGTDGLCFGFPTG